MASCGLPSEVSGPEAHFVGIGSAVAGGGF